MATTDTSTVRPMMRERGGRHRLEHLMGMPIVVDVCDPDFDAARIDRVYDWLRRVDATFSTYRADSQISRLNRGELALADADTGRPVGPGALPIVARRDRWVLRCVGRRRPAARRRSGSG